MPGDLASMPDALLVAHVADGRAECAEELIARYERALGSFLRRAMAGAPEWEDLFQETWLRVVRYASSYDPSYRFSTWLFRVAWNVVRRHLSYRCVQEERLNRGDTVVSGEYIDPTIAADQGLGERERANAVAAAVRILPSLLGEAVFLRYFEEMSEREMASRLCIPAGTVKSRLHSGLKRLATLLDRSMS